MVTDAELLRLSIRTGTHLLAAGARIATAESCTAGWLAKVLTEVPGCSRWFECGYVCYSNAAKVRDLGVRTETLDAQGAVSEPVVRALAEGALERSGAEVAVAISGIAGPTGAVPGKPVGTVEVVARVKFFDGDRDEVRRKAVQFALQLVLGLDLPAVHTGA